MKKLLSLITLALCILLLMGCAATEPPIEAPDVKSIEYVVRSELNTYRLIDFETGKFYYKKRTAYDIGAGPYVPLCDLAPAKEEAFLIAATVAGIFELEKSYYATDVYDSFGWDLIITFADGTERKTTGYHVTPEEVFCAFDEAFVKSYGTSFFGNFYDSKLMETPTMNYLLTSPDTPSVSCANSVSPTSFKWYSKELSCDDIVAYAKNHTDYLYREGGSYRLSLSPTKSHFVYDGVEVYSLAADGTDKRAEAADDADGTVGLDVEAGRIYVLSFSFGENSCEYVIPTLVDSLDSLPEDFDLYMDIESTDWRVGISNDTLWIMPTDIYAESYELEVDDATRLEIYRLLRESDAFYGGEPYYYSHNHSVLQYHDYNVENVGTSLTVRYNGTVRRVGIGGLAVDKTPEDGKWEELLALLNSIVEAMLTKRD